MKIVVAYKWARDVEEIFVYNDGSTKIRRDRLTANDDDAAALLCARATAEATNSTITAVTIGNGDASWAAARGANQLMSAETYMPSIDNAITAREIANAISKAGEADLVVLGENREHSGITGAVAALLGLPVVAGVADFDIDPANEQYIIAHRKHNKTIETLRIALPAVISVAATEQEKGIPSIKQMLAAKKVPVETIEAEEMPALRIAQTAHRCPEVHRAHIFEGDVAQAAQELVAALRADGTL